MSHVLSRLWTNRNRDCRWCGRQIMQRNRGPHGDRASADHILPKERGGCDGTGDDADDSNVVLTHRRCNEARAEADHCVAALCCALSVIGTNPRAGEVRHWYTGLRGMVGNAAENHERNMLYRKAFPPFDVWWPVASAQLAYGIFGWGHGT